MVIFGPFSGPDAFKKVLCYTLAVIISKTVKLHLESYLIFAVIGYTSLPSSKHVGKNKDTTVFSIRDTLCIDWKTRWLFTKTQNVYAITRDSASFDLGYSTEHRGLVEDVGKWNCSDDDPKVKPLTS